MKHNILKVSLMGIALLVAMPSVARPQTIKPQLSKTDPVTGLGSADWLSMVGGFLKLDALNGVPGVVMVNALPVPVTVTCDKWTLVGQNPYDRHNPASLPPFSVSYVRTDGFDGYCRAGVVGHAGARTLIARLDSSDGSFSAATMVTFGDQ